MEIRQGYKQTEVGIIPEEWEVKKIKDILEIGSGKDYKKLSSGDIPVFGTGGYMLSVDDFLYDGESVFIGRKGTINKPFYYKGKFWTVDTLFYTYNFRNVFPKWVLYKFDTINWLKYNEASGVPSLSKQTIYNIDIAIPPLKEQEKIAEILSYYDKAIEQQELLIEKEKEFKKGMMQKIFSQEIRFKDDNGEDYPEWEEKKLGEVIEFTQSGLSRKLSNENIGITVLRSNNLLNGKIDRSDIKYWYKVDPQKAKIEDYFLENGDILINFINSIAQIGKSAIYYGKEKEIFTTNILRMRINKENNLNYVFYILNTKRYDDYIQSITKPAVNQASFTTTDFKNFILPIPPLKEQEKIANFLFNIDNKIELLEKKLELLKNEKKGMMRKLLTGEVRV